MIFIKRFHLASDTQLDFQNYVDTIFKNNFRISNEYYKNILFYFLKKLLFYFLIMYYSIS